MKIYSAGLNNTHESGIYYQNYQRKNVKQNQMMQSTLNKSLNFQAKKSFFERIFGQKQFKDVISQIEQESVEINSGIKTTYKYFDSNAGKKFNSKLEQDLNGNFIALTKYKYKPDSEYNQLLSTYNFDKDNKFMWKTNYKYNEENLISETANVDLQDNLLHKTKYLYGGNYYGRWLSYTADYDKSGNKLKLNKYFEPEWGPIEGRFIKDKVEAELLISKDLINQFFAEHQHEASLFKLFDYRLKELTPQNYEFMINYDKEGGLKSIYKIYKPEKKLDQYGQQMPYISEQGILYNEKGEIDKFIVNYKEATLYARNVRDTVGEYTHRNIQEIFTPHGILKERRTQEHCENYYDDGKTIHEIFSHLGRGEAFYKEYSPDQKLMRYAANETRFGGSGSQGTLYVIEEDYTNGNNKYNMYVARSGRDGVYPPDIIEVPQFYNSTYHYQRTLFE